MTDPLMEDGLRRPMWPQTGGTMNINDAITHALVSVSWKVDRISDRGDQTTLEVSPERSYGNQTNLMTRKTDVQSTWDTWTEAKQGLGREKLKTSLAGIVSTLRPGTSRNLSPADWTPSA
jgi:hypothetical protein